MSDFYQQKADWLMGFDFDGTLANPDDNHSVDPRFFDYLAQLKEQKSLLWGICTGRSLEFTIEGVENANFPLLPDYLVTKEREIFYRAEDEWVADQQWNQSADRELVEVLDRSEVTIQKAKQFIETETSGKWFATPGEPAAIIAESEQEVEKVVNIFEECSEKCEYLDYQRNTIYLRFSHKQFSKGTAFSHIRDRLNVPMQNSLTAGDNFNDVSMLNAQTAFHYGCPANSLPSLLEQMRKTDGKIAKANYSLGVMELIQRSIG